MRQLTAATLERLETRLRAHGAAAVPGHVSSPERIAAAAVGGVPVPAELVLWWSWQPSEARRQLPGAEFLSLEQALEEYTARRESASRLARAPANMGGTTTDDLWRPTWLPLMPIDGGMIFVADLGGSDGQVVPIRLLDWQDPVDSENFARIAARSLGDYVEHIIDAVDAGRFVYDADPGFWSSSDPDWPNITPPAGRHGSSDPPSA